MVVSSTPSDAAPAATRVAPGYPSRRTLAIAAALAALALAATHLARRQMPAPERPAAGRVVFVDVVGWYGRSPDEVAVLTPHDLTIDGLPEGLPMSLGDWRGADRPHDTAVDVYLDRPDLTLERTYWRPDGEVVWVTAFGSRGAKSFRLFEHTPETCYPLGGWAIERFGRELVALGPLPLPVNLGVASGPEGQMVFLYFYVWDSPDRDSELGVLTFRVAAPVSGAVARTRAMLTEEFLPNMLGPTIPWSRF